MKTTSETIHFLYRECERAQTVSRAYHDNCNLNPMKKHVFRKSLITILLLLGVFSCKQGPDGLVQLHEARPVKGFNFPYFLYVPDGLSAEKMLTMVVEPNNSGFVNDSLEVHLDRAKSTASSDFFIGHYVAHQLTLPLLVPVFPRPESQWMVYTHALDRDAMLQQDNELERLDLQLLAMVADASDKLAEMGYVIDQKVFLTGFSASGTFANRFTMVHPGRIKAMAAGGLNGLLILPLDSLKGRMLNYPIGIHDFDSIVGSTFNMPEFRQTPQFLFMGALDDNDAIPYADGYDDGERELIYSVLGAEMMPVRWQNCTTVYHEQNINAMMKVYEGIGHKHPDAVKNDIVRFFEKHLN